MLDAGGWTRHQQSSSQSAMAQTTQKQIRKEIMAASRPQAHAATLLQRWHSTLWG